MKFKNVLIALSFVVLSPSYPYTVVNAQEVPEIASSSPIIQLTSTSTPQEVITYYASKYGVPEALPLAIANAESQFDPNAHNPSATSTASGLFEINNPTFIDMCINRYKITSSMEYKNRVIVQTKCAILMLRDGLQERWSASEVKWSKLLASS